MVDITDVADELPAGALSPTPRAVSVRGARYVGGHPKWTDPAEATFLSISARGLEFRINAIPIFVPLSVLSSIDVLAEDTAQRVFEDLGVAGESDDPGRGLHRTSCLSIGADFGRIGFALTPSEREAANALVESMRELFEEHDVEVNQSTPFVTSDAHAEDLVERGDPSVVGHTGDETTVEEEEEEEEEEDAESENDTENETDLGADEEQVGKELELEGDDRCSKGHQLTDDALFCPTCGELIGSRECANGHVIGPDDVVCEVCETTPSMSAGDLSVKIEMLRGEVSEGKATLRAMRDRYQDDVSQLSEKIGQSGAVKVLGAVIIEGDRDELLDLLGDQKLLALSKELHEHLVEVKRAELNLATVEGEAGVVSPDIAAALVALRRIELEFASLMLLEVTELIAVPPADEDGRRMVIEHVGELLADCAQRRLDALGVLARKRGEPHGVRAAELEVELSALQDEIKALNSEESRDGRGEEIEALKNRHAEVLLDQLEERRLASELLGDDDDAREASALIDLIRAAQASGVGKRAESAPSKRRRSSTVEDELSVEQMREEMSGLFAERTSKHSNRQRLAVAKRFLSDFRAFFVAHPGPEGDPEDELMVARAEAWNSYDVLTRKLMALPIGSMHRGADGKRPQWGRSNGMILELGSSRIAVVDIEIKVAEEFEDMNRAEVLRVLRAALVADLERVREEIRASSVR
ncbi:MAG: zinc ribbon domain-containing protein [Actinobacteria bacterium]|nr:zinc ribbon domain-containing protein [Actinomycetota bacterium]